MSTISVPLPTHLEDFITRSVRHGYGSTKADVVRRALTRLMEEEAMQAVIQAEQEIKDGKALKGNLRKLLKALP